MSATRRSPRDPHPVVVPAEQQPPREPIAERRLRLEEVECQALSVRLPTPRREGTGRQALLRRIVSEFEEMPGTALTVAQASRLFDLPRDACARILSDLADVGLLHRDVKGCYRLPAGSVGRKAG